MVRVPEAATFLQINENFGPGLFIDMLDMAKNMRRVPDESRRRAYLAWANKNPRLTTNNIIR